MTRRPPFIPPSHGPSSLLSISLDSPCCSSRLSSLHHLVHHMAEPRRRPRVQAGIAGSVRRKVLPILNALESRQPDAALRRRSRTPRSADPSPPHASAPSSRSAASHPRRLHLQAHPKPVRHRRAAHQGMVLRPLPAALRRHACRHRHRQLEAQIRLRHASVARRMGRIRSPERPCQLRLRAPRRHLSRTLLAADDPPPSKPPRSAIPSSRNSCVRNDVSLDPNTRFYLISGSNMAGKSTLLRAIGLNAVLAYAGAPVRAASLRLTPLTVGASLALTDSLAENKSKFLAEVQRLHAILARQPASAPPSSSSTSSSAAPTLTTAAPPPKPSCALLRPTGHRRALHPRPRPHRARHAREHGLNVHMASPDPDDPLAFDFHLKPGINPSSSALAIIRMIGIASLNAQHHPLRVVRPIPHTHSRHENPPRSHSSPLVALPARSPRRRRPRPRRPSARTPSPATRTSPPSPPSSTPSTTIPSPRPTPTAPPAASSSRSSPAPTTSASSSPRTTTTSPSSASANPPPTSSSPTPSTPTPPAAPSSPRPSRSTAPASKPTTSPSRTPPATPARPSP